MAAPWLATALASTGVIGTVAALNLGAAARPVRAILFDKSAATNWALAWHQDRTICVAERIDVAGCGPWTVKQGMVHVAPPFGILAGMVTLRIHLDDVPADNAPLLVAPGSHRLGRITESAIAAAVTRLPCRRGRYLALRDADSSRIQRSLAAEPATRPAGRLRRR